MNARSTLPVLRFPQLLAWENSPGRRFVAVAAFNSCGRFCLAVPRWSNNRWTLPGGTIEKGETEVAAAIREMKEETGLALDWVTPVADIHNYTTGGRTQSTVRLMTGIVGSSEAVAGDVAAAGFFANLPEECVFGQEWTAMLLARARVALASALNRNVWAKNGEHYAATVRFSTSEVHYGPLIPGEHHLKLLPNLGGARVLDLGCGRGDNLMALRAAGAASGVGIDFDPSNAKAARRYLNDPAFAVIKADIQSVDISALGPFDLAISVFSLAFVASPTAVMRKLGPAMKPGGRLILSTDHPLRRGKWLGDHQRIDDWFGPALSIKDWCADGECYPSARFIHSLPDLVEALREGGFHVERILEPQIEDETRSPYSGGYYLSRLRELKTFPYTLIIVGVRT